MQLIRSEPQLPRMATAAPFDRVCQPHRQLYPHSGDRSKGAREDRVPSANNAIAKHRANDRPCHVTLFKMTTAAPHTTTAGRHHDQRRGSRDQGRPPCNPSQDMLYRSERGAPACLKHPMGHVLTVAPRSGTKRGRVAKASALIGSTTATVGHPSNTCAHDRWLAPTQMNATEVPEQAARTPRWSHNDPEAA